MGWQEYEKIKSLRQLKKYKRTELFIRLNGGLKSSKEVEWDKGWSIWHGISDTTSTYKTDKQFKENEQFFMKAMKEGALWREI